MGTSADCVDALKARLHELHSYQAPEFLVLQVQTGSERYLAWLEDSLKKS